MFDETHDAQKSQGWTPLILDTNGNGKRDDYTEPGQPTDPAKDTRIKVGYYGIIPSPADGSVWGTVLGFPGGIVRVNPGPDPAKTALAEYYEVPWNEPEGRRAGLLAARDWTLTPTASFGPSSPAAILPASTAASAKAR